MPQSKAFQFVLAAVFALSTQVSHAQNAEQSEDAVRMVFSHPLPELVVLSPKAEGSFSVATDSRTGTTVNVTVEKGIPVKIEFFDSYSNALAPGDPSQCNSVLNPTFTQQCLAGDEIVCQPIPVGFEDCFCTCTSP